MDDTIAAIATGGAISAIGIVRVSGPLAIDAAGAVFSAPGGVRLHDAEPRKLYYGELRGRDGGVIDACLCTISRAPNSYTGEDTAEFQCHGSPVVLSEALLALFSHGVRQAGPGEFTKRAFLNGRMDLSQAEAVIDLIEAETPAAAKNAAGQLAGAISRRADDVYGSLLDIIAHFHAVIDYPDEDIDDFQAEKYIKTLTDAETALNNLLATFERGQILKDGIPSAIAGRPNTGKSSLLNALLGYDRAIVTATAGTTRDTIEEKLRIGPALLRLIDTAGLRDTADEVERLGVLRTREAVSAAKLLIMVFDGSQPLCDEDYETLNLAAAAEHKIAVINKSDLPQVVCDDEIAKSGAAICRVSALTGAGLDALEMEITRIFPTQDAQNAGEVMTNARQFDAARRACASIAAARDAIAQHITPDAVLTEVEAALAAIGEITGKTMREDITARIFERFCVGK